MHKKHLALCAATTAGVIGLAGLAITPAAARATDPRTDLTSASEQLAHEGRQVSVNRSAALSATFDGLSTSPRSAKALTSDSDYYLRDTYTDDYYDTYAMPGLIGSSIAVPRSNGSTLLGVGALDEYSNGYMTVIGGAALLIDTNADGQTDYMAMTPDSYMALDSGYQTPISMKVSGNWVNTGQYAVWLRGDDYYGVGLDWKALGVKDVQWTFGVIDEDGEADFAPDSYSTRVDLGYGQSVTPPPSSGSNPGGGTTPGGTPSPGGGTVQSVPAKVGAISTINLKGRTKLDWPNTAGAITYRIKVSTNGSKYRTWGTVSSSKVTLATKSGKTYSVAVQAKNSVGYGSARYRTFKAR